MVRFSHCVGTHTDMHYWPNGHGSAMIGCKDCGFARRGRTDKQKMYIFGYLLNNDCSHIDELPLSGYRDFEDI